MKKVKITAVRRTEYPDLMAIYENPIQHACDIAIGRSWISEDARKPEGLCDSAWESMRPFVEDLAAGRGNFFDGWMRNPLSAMISCNDGFRPVSFYLEVVGSPEIKTGQDINPDSMQKHSRYNGEAIEDLSIDPNYKAGFNAWVGRDPKVLVLGTLPGDTSIKEREFYEDPRNSFWKLMYEILPLNQDESFASRKEFITSRRIALWDCLASAIRDGSKDSKIVKGTEKGNDIQGFLNEYPTIQTIVLNGKRDTVKYFHRFCNVTKPIRVIALPSTASMTTYKSKVEAWSVVKELL